MTNQAVLEVQGMTCETCERHVALALTSAGAQAVRADWLTSVARFSLPDAVDEGVLRDAVTASGCTPRALHAASGTRTAGAGPAPQITSPGLTEARAT